MENVNSKNYYLENPKVLPNLDPSKKLKLGWFNLSICSQYLDIRGQTVEFIHRGKETVTRYHYQQCRCLDEEDIADDNVIPVWLYYHFNKAVEFCHCCSKELINTGSNYSLLYCDDCLKLVLDYNGNARRRQLPLTRHPSINGIVLVPPYTEKEEETYRSRVSIFNEKLNTINEWQKLCLFENLHDLGFDLKQNINMADYNECVNDLRHSKEYYLNRMVHYLLYHF